MKKIPIQLLEYLVQECTREVLDQIIEEQKLKVKYGKETTTEVPIKHKIPVKAGDEKKTMFGVPVKHVNEADDAPMAQGSSALAVAEPKSNNTSVKPAPDETPEKQEKPETPPLTSKGPVVINPRDKSKLEPIRFQGQDESAIERILHTVAARVSGPRTKVSLGAKRLAREVASNPDISVYFYFGKMDPESDEIFLMADKSLQIAKNDSIQPSDLQGAPASSTIDKPADPDYYMPTYHDLAPKNDAEYFAYQAQKRRGTPRYGIDENTQALIKKAINKILDRR